MNPWSTYLLKQVFSAYSLVGSLQIADFTDRVTIQTLRDDKGQCITDFSVGTAGEMGSQLLIYPVDRPAPGSIYQGNFEDVWKDGVNFTNSVWEDSYYVQEAVTRRDGSRGFSMPSLTVLDKQRTFTMKLSIWKDRAHRSAILKSISCNPDSCTCEEVPVVTHVVK